MVVFVITDSIFAHIECGQKIWNTFYAL